jgi:glycosyltransferase involved in cell wall biosynthesis
MSDAALYFHPGGYDTSGPELLGRLAAGESFLRGYVRHAATERFRFWNVAGRPQAELEALLERIEAPAKPVTWIGRNSRSQLREAGVLNMPVPGLADESWARRRIGARTYAICGITHTTATDRTMKTLAEMLIAPTEDYDALICTSNAVRQSVDIQFDQMREYLAAEFGPRRRTEPQRVTIPLGVNVDDFATTPEHRKAWREKLDIPQDAVVALFVGRFNVQEKMNPALMALALERAAKNTGKPIYWVNSGWARNATLEGQYHDLSRALCPSVHYRNVDGRKPDVRFSIWSVADFFISFSDNIQETFGLTPVEAMAAGLPSVVSDWDGYRDTVRHGVDGFRVPTMAPPAGFGGDLAYWYENHWLNYHNYVGATAQFTSVDLFEAEKMISALVENEDLRKLFGSQAKAQARAAFDWKAIIPQYEALWAEQNARRLAAAPDSGSTANPFSPDPFTLFQSYPTRHLSVDNRLLVPPGMDWAQAHELLTSPLAGYAAFNRPTLEEVEQVLTWLTPRGGATVRQLIDEFPSKRRSFVHRGLLWLARYGVIRILPAA